LDDAGRAHGERLPTRAEKAEVARKHAAYLASSIPDAESLGFKIGVSSAGLDWALAIMRREMVVLNAIADDYEGAT